MEYEEVDPIVLSVDEEAEISVADLSRMVAASLGFQGAVVFDKTRADGQLRKTASNEKLRKYLPNFVFTSLEDGLNETSKWFVRAFAEARK